jgi:hypothetical protein
MNRTRVIGLLFFLLWALTVPCQRHLLSSREIDDKFSQRWKTGEADKKNYSWNVKTEVTRNEKVMQVLIEEISFRSDGREIRKVISDQQAPLPSTFIIRQVAEDQKARIIAFMKGLQGFLEKYALTDDNKRHAFFSAANMGVPDETGQLLVSGTGIFTRGDKLNWWIDTRTYSITKATISTTFEGTGAEFSATYNLFPGLNYMSQATIRVPSKNMVIKLQFSGFTRHP